jgi:hypothetical protein
MVSLLIGPSSAKSGPWYFNVFKGCAMLIQVGFVAKAAIGFSGPQPTLTCLLVLDDNAFKGVISEIPVYKITGD